MYSSYYGGKGKYKIDQWNFQMAENSLSLSLFFSPLRFSSFAQLCPTMCDPIDCNTPGFPVHHQFTELAQIHVHRVKSFIQLFFAFLEFNKNLFCPIILWTLSEGSHSVMSDPCDPMNVACQAPPSRRRIFQARILEQVAISFSRGSSRSRDQTWVSCTAGRLVTIWTTREVNTQGKHNKYSFAQVLYCVHSLLLGCVSSCTNV